MKVYGRNSDNETWYLRTGSFHSTLIIINVSILSCLFNLMPETKIIIVGCGIAGPVLATFLKLKGYNPVIYERLTDDPEGGRRLL
jgi:hypothetical protein